MNKADYKLGTYIHEDELKLGQKRIEQLEAEIAELKAESPITTSINMLDIIEKLRAANEVLRDGIKEAIRVEDELCAVTVSGILESALESAGKIMKGECNDNL